MQEALRDYERSYEETVRRIKKEKNGTYSRNKLLGKYTAKLLYGWNNESFKKKYLKKLEENWRQ